MLFVVLYKKRDLCILYILKFSIFQNNYVKRHKLWGYNYKIFLLFFFNLYSILCNTMLNNMKSETFSRFDTNLHFYLYFYSYLAKIIVKLEIGTLLFTDPNKFILIVIPEIPLLILNSWDDEIGQITLKLCSNCSKILKRFLISSYPSH